MWPTELFTKFVITKATRRVPHVEQDLLTLPEHLRSPLVFKWGSCCLFFSFLWCIMCAVVCLSFSFLAMALSVCFRFMSLTVPLVSFVPLLSLLQRTQLYASIVTKDTTQNSIVTHYPGPCSHRFKSYNRYNEMWYECQCRNSLINVTICKSKPL